MDELAEPRFGLNASGIAPAERGDGARPQGRLALAAWPPLLRAMRPLQWTKNGLVLAPLLFTHMFFDLEPVIRSIAAAVIFCAVSSAIYLVNDVRDVEQDRIHPRKRYRPIAAGELDASKALIAAAGLIALALSAAFVLRPAFGTLIVGYIALMVTYSFGLKRLVIIDVFAIAAGFVLRAAGGALALEVPISPWLYVCSALLALFLGFGKRRNELSLLQGSAVLHRENLDSYSLQVLDQIIAVVSAATVIAYSLYTFDAPAVPQDHSLMLTIPFVAYAVFRYLFLIYRKDQGGSPEIVILTDRPLMLCVFGWALTSIVILYWA